MKERPILFNPEMVRAILEGRKTQTRRIIKPQFYEKPSDILMWPCPFGKVGEHLWVRETFCDWGAGSNRIQYKADTSDLDEEMSRQAMGKIIWTPSIHMPRWASRLTLEITEIRVERLRDISEDDAMAEGVEFDHGWEGEPSYGYLDYLSADESFKFLTAKRSFQSLWESINGENSWSKNPWVWVVSFKEVK